MKTVISKLKVIFSNKEIRDKILFSLFIVVLYRVFAAIPVVGIPADALTKLFQQNGLGDIISTVSGGVLETSSVIAVGLGPYINASVILQLLSSVFPKLEEMRNEGTEGRRKISMFTRYLTLPLAILQSFLIYATLRGFGLMPVLPTLELVAMSLSLTAGAMLMMWWGELISESGLGGGSSFIIFLGIVASMPGRILSNISTMDSLELGIFIVVILAIIAVTIYINEAEYRVKIVHSRRVLEGRGVENYIPLKLVQAGVMPVIFAMSLLSFPQFIAQFLISQNFNEQLTTYAQKFIEILSNPWVYNGSMFLLIIAFSLFYLTIIFNTEEYAENLQKQGAFIPNIRPGEETANYLKKLSFQLVSIGAVYMAVLSIIPTVFVAVGIWDVVIFSGTGLLILISVVMDVYRQIKSLIVVRSYDKYI